MLSSVWHRLSSSYSRRRSGIDTGNIEHVRADLRFRLALLEYVYFGRSGRRVRRCLKALYSILGKSAMHRYLRSLDPDLRTQFIERFQGVQRDNQAEGGDGKREHRRRSVAAREGVSRTAEAVLATSNVVPIGHAARRSERDGNAAATDETLPSHTQPANRSID